MNPVMLPEGAPFTEAQRYWLNGFFAGLAGHHQSSNGALPSISDGSSAQGTTQIASMEVYVAYGSQTGAAEGVAFQIADSYREKYAHSNPIDFKVFALDKYADYTWKNIQHLLVVTSTQGDGELPENAKSFAKWIKDNGTSVAHIEYCILGLGDSSYRQFCQGGVILDQLFSDAGAQRILPLQKCDKDYEADAQAWIDVQISRLHQLSIKAAGNSLTPSITKSSPSEAKTTSVSTSNATGEKNIEYGKKNPFPAVLIENRHLNGKASAKDTRHISLSILGGGFVYEPGDTLGIYPVNPFELVDQMILRLNASGGEVVVLRDGQKMTLRRALLSYSDLFQVPKDLLRQLQKVCRGYTAGKKINELCEKIDSNEVREYLRTSDVLDILRDFSTIYISPQDLISALSRLTPRLYSISSSQKWVGDEVHLTIGIVKSNMRDRLRKGVSSNHLAGQVALGETIPIFFNKNPHFRLPASSDTPIIMVGPGTGIAPFRAFLQERRAIAAQGKNWLLFGDQHEALDYIYKDELSGLVKDGILHRVDTAFSRDQEQKIYVQDRLLSAAREVYTWLENGAHFYICGDAKRMAVDVENALLTIIQSEGGKSLESAKEYLQELKASKRYQKDVY